MIVKDFLAVAAPKTKTTLHTRLKNLGYKRLNNYSDEFHVYRHKNRITPEHKTKLDAALKPHGFIPSAKNKWQHETHKGHRDKPRKAQAYNYPNHVHGVDVYEGHRGHELSVEKSPSSWW